MSSTPAPDAASRGATALAVVAALALASSGSALLALPSVARSFGAVTSLTPAVSMALAICVAVARKNAGARPVEALVGAALTFAASVCIAEGALHAAWSLAPSHGALIGGRIPYSDASDYLSGAERLLRHGRLDEFTSRRPLNVSLLAARIALTGGSAVGALHLQALLLAASTWLAAREIAVDLGWSRAAVVAFGALAFGVVFVPTTLSESLGVTLGALALATLWGAAREPSAWRLAASGVLLAAGLWARSGPMFALVTVAAWAAWRCRGEGARGMAVAAAAFVGGAGGGAGLARVLLRVHHGLTDGAQANAAYTFYGLAHGGQGWELAWHDHPEIATLGDVRAAAWVRRLTVEHIAAHPGDLALGLARNVQCLARTCTGEALRAHPVAEGLLFGAIVAALVAWTVRRWRATRGAPQLALGVAVTVGAALSVPVVYMDGGDRVFAVAVPSMLAFAALLLPVPLGARRERPTVAAPMLGFAMLIAAMVAPRLARVHPTPTPPMDCAAGEVPVDVDAATAPLRVAIGLRPGGLGVPLAEFRPRIAYVPYLGTNGLAAALGTLPAVTDVSGLFDDRAATLVYLVAPAGVVPTRGRFRACTRAFGGGARPLRQVTRIDASP